MLHLYPVFVLKNGNGIMALEMHYADLIAVERSYIGFLRWAIVITAVVSILSAFPAILSLDWLDPMTRDLLWKLAIGAAGLLNVKLIRDTYEKRKIIIEYETARDSFKQLKKESPSKAMALEEKWIFQKCGVKL
jgi:hypothetical protein